MKKFIFRAKRKDYHKWVYGNILAPFSKEDGYRYYIKNGDSRKPYEVTYDTICRFVGTQDRNGKDIYENDVIDCRYGYGVVKFSEEHLAVMLDFRGKVYTESLAYFPINDLKIVGNKFDMKELEVSNYMGQYVANACRLKMIGYDCRSWEQVASDFGYTDKNVLLNEFVKSYMCKYRHFVIRKLREDNDWFLWNR